MSNLAPKLTQKATVSLRKVFQLLEDQFDDENGVYRNDYSDKRIADETGISENTVKQHRTQAFGKLRPPTELHQMQQELKEIETLTLQLDNDLRRKVKDFELRLSRFAKKFD